MNLQRGSIQKPEDTSGILWPQQGTPEPPSYSRPIGRRTIILLPFWIYDSYFRLYRPIHTGEMSGALSGGIVRIPTNSLSKNAISDTFISQNRVCELLVIMNYILDDVRQYAMLSTLH